MLALTQARPTCAHGHQQVFSVLVQEGVHFLRAKEKAENIGGVLQRTAQVRTADLLKATEQP